MDIKVLSYHPQPFGDYQLGFCEAKMGGSVHLLTLLRSKKGNIYLSFSSKKIGDNWVSTFKLDNEDFEKKFLAECLEQVKPMMTQQTQPPISQEEANSFREVMNDEPF